MNHSITVILSTYNRASVLRETLESFCELDLSGLDVEFVIVDNNSTDHTPHVVAQFEGVLPIRYLFEPRPGKNCALNYALDTVDLREIVVFTDDDIVPATDWLQQILVAKRENSDVCVFGGAINVLWPGSGPPAWSRCDLALSLGYARHYRGAGDMPYVPGDFPFGANMWVSRKVIANGRRFNESIGPRPTRRIMGSETSFLYALANDGYQAWYVGAALVSHRVDDHCLSRWGLIKRAFRYGRSRPHIAGLPKPNLFESHPLLWQLRIVASFLPLSLRFVIAWFHFSQSRSLEQAMRAAIDVGHKCEALRVVREDW